LTTNINVTATAASRAESLFVTAADVVIRGFLYRFSKKSLLYVKSLLIAKRLSD